MIVCVRCNRNDLVEWIDEKSLKGKKLQVVVNPRKGEFRNAPATRRVEIVLEGMSVNPATVRVNGKSVTAVKKGTATVISIPECAVGEKSVVTATIF